MMLEYCGMFVVRLGKENLMFEWFSINHPLHFSANWHKRVLIEINGICNRVVLY